MDISYKTREWLQIAFIEQINRLNECYFFDRFVNEFYSVFITDYFLIDPKSSEELSSSPYTQEQLKVLSERIKRQMINDPSIALVPRLTIKERQEMMQLFLDQQGIQDIKLRKTLLPMKTVKQIWILINFYQQKLKINGSRLDGHLYKIKLTLIAIFITSI
jgi:hypothetical protein